MRNHKRIRRNDVYTNKIGAEITLEHGELCVSGDTRILTRNGYPRIKDVVNKEVEVWNGVEWSKVKPVQTGSNKKLLRIGFSDGSYLDTTFYHKFSIENGRHFGIPKLKEVEAKDLKIGDKLEKLTVDSSKITGIHDENSFEWGFFAGDGYIEKNDIMAVICGEKEKLSHFLNGKLGKPQIREGYADPVNRINFTNSLKDLEIAKELNDKDKGIPEYFFNLDYGSTMNFIAGWLDTDGTIQKNENSWNYRIYGSYQKMLDMQLLLRRVGVNGVTVSLASPKGFETNFGKRNRDLFYVTIPSPECYKIPTKLTIIPFDFISSGKTKNNAHENSKEINLMKRQYVESIEVLEGEHSTYCFTENKLHKGVFGNVLTHQCNLIEMFPNNHSSLDDFRDTIKYAYLFAKTITLLNTNWEETNKVMLKNRRIGLSITGVAQFLANDGIDSLKKWLEEGYKTAKYYDEIYSEWLAIPRSKKITTVKPSGTLSLLAGATPGMHFPESRFYKRRVRLAKNSKFLPILENAGYHIEPANEDPQGTLVVEFPVSVGQNVKTINEVSMWEQIALAQFLQENWADNSVSVTITFKKNEASQISSALDYCQYKLKAISFLPKMEGGAYPQMPYEEITEEEYLDMSYNLNELNFSEIFSEESVGEKYCNNDSCAF